MIIFCCYHPIFVKMTLLPWPWFLVVALNFYGMQPHSVSLTSPYPAAQVGNEKMWQPINGFNLTPREIETKTLPPLEWGQSHPTDIQSWSSICIYYEHNWVWCVLTTLQEYVLLELKIRSIYLASNVDRPSPKGWDSANTNVLRIGCLGLEI